MKMFNRIQTILHNKKMTLSLLDNCHINNKIMKDNDKSEKKYSQGHYVYSTNNTISRNQELETK